MVFKLQLVIVFLYVAVCQSRNFQNPIVEGEDRAKVIKYNNSYYMVTQNYGDKENVFPIRASTDLKNWTNVSSIFTADNHPPWAYNDTLPESPFLHYDGMIFYAFFLDAEYPNGYNRQGVAKSSSVEGPYIPEPKSLNLPMDDPYDAVIIEDPINGDTYLMWEFGGAADIWGQRFYLQNLTVAEGGPVRLLKAVYPWQNSYLSSPNFFFWNNFYYIFYTTAGSSYDRAVIGVARSKYPMGPYDQLETPVITNAAGPNIVEDVDGSSHVLVYSASSNGDRAVNATTLLWDADDWPYVSYE